MEDIGSMCADRLKNYGRLQELYGAIDSPLVVAYVETGLQLMCVKEFLLSSTSTDYVIFSRRSRSEKVNQRLTVVGECLDVKLCWQKIGGKRDIKGLFLLAANLRKQLKRDKTILLLGDKDSLVCRVLTKIAYPKTIVVYVDDGVATFDQYRSAVVKNEKVNWYSIFDLPSTENIGVVGHAFENVKSIPCLQRSITASKQSIFLGSPMVEGGFMTGDDYASYIRSACERACRPITYVPHPKENNEQVRRLAENHGVIVSNASDLPIEIRLLKGELAADEVFSMMSTATFTLASILTFATIYGFELPTRHLGLAKTRGAYSHFEKVVEEALKLENFRLISINES